MTSENVTIKKEYCPNCFNAIGSMRPCPYCGNEQFDRKNPLALPVNVVLKNRYVVGRMLGAGGFGITYKCYDLKERKICAIKEYAPSTSATRLSDSLTLTATSVSRQEIFEHGREKFLGEAATLSQLQDIPDVVKIWDCFEMNGTAYFVMEFLSGSTLNGIKKAYGGRIEYSVAYGIILQAAESLGKIHEEGNIISQDIKAGTILKKGDTIRVTVSKGALVTIPDVAGKKKAKAKETITNAKLIMKVSDRKWSDKVAKGKVISQDKKAGEKIEEGNTISVVISKGVEQVKVPKVEGETLEEAQKALKKAKLKVDSSRTYSSSVEEGKIISQSIASGKTVDKNTTVKVVISLGKEPEPEPVYRPSSSSSSSGSSSSGRKSYRRSGSSSSSSRKSSGSKKKSSGGGDSINNWNLVN